jgi:outer membrane lipoprotein-sorting protein
MRWWMAIVGCVVFAGAAQAQDAAQKLYESMEKKCSQAKAQKIDFAAEVTDRPGGQMTIKGSALLATGNRIKMTFEGTEGNRAMKGTVVSDGKMMVMKGEFDGKPDSKTQPAPEQLYQTLNGWLIRAGLFLAFESGLRQNPKDASELKLSGFKMLAKDKVGGRDANVIEFQMTPAEAKDSVGTCKLWLDTQTNLPLKRTIEVTRNGKSAERITETYAQWEVDPIIADSVFMLPK